MVDDKYRGAPLRTTREARERADKTLRAIYGTRVKIPPPGPGRDELCAQVVAWLFNETGWGSDHYRPDEYAVGKVLDALEEIVG